MEESYWDGQTDEIETSRRVESWEEKKCLFLFFEHRIVRLFLRVHEQFEKGPATQLQDTGKKKGDLDLF